MVCTYKYSQKNNVEDPEWQNRTIMVHSSHLHLKLWALFHPPGTGAIYYPLYSEYPSVTYSYIGYYTVNSQVIWIEMFGSKPWTIYPLGVDLII